MLPGVTVEAASPALIEKVRTVVTDGEGRYNIVDLRPGTYVGHLHAGRLQHVQAGRDRADGGFTATVNADMQVGALEETITVTGAAPLVDTQNVRQQTRRLERAARGAADRHEGRWHDLVTLIPGLTAPPMSAARRALYRSNGATWRHVPWQGRRARSTYDGMEIDNLHRDGNRSATSSNPAVVEEMTVETGGISAESSASGISINMIPKEGGNTFTVDVDGTVHQRAACRATT